LDEVAGFQMKPASCAANLLRNARSTQEKFAKSQGQRFTLKEIQEKLSGFSPNG
jgi:hypothetical protein